MSEWILYIIYAKVNDVSPPPPPWLFVLKQNKCNSRWRQDRPSCHWQLQVGQSQHFPNKIFLFPVFPTQLCLGLRPTSTARASGPIWLRSPLKKKTKQSLGKFIGEDTGQRSIGSGWLTRTKKEPGHWHRMVRRRNTWTGISPTQQSQSQTTTMATNIARISDLGTV